MGELLNFVLKGILGDIEFTLEESTDEGRIIYKIVTKPENIGLIIGKGGKTIKALRSLLKVRATLEKKIVALNIGE